MINVVEEGVYFLFDKGELVYIGESDNLFRRIGQHIYEKQKVFDAFEIYPCADRKRLEGFLIRLLHPKYNISEGMSDWTSQIGEEIPVWKVDVNGKSKKDGLIKTKLLCGK